MLTAKGAQRGTSISRLPPDERLAWNEEENPGLKGKPWDWKGGEERVALRVCARSVLDVNGTAVGGLQLVRQEFIRAVPFDGDKVHGA